MAFLKGLSILLGFLLLGTGLGDLLSLPVPGPVLGMLLLWLALQLGWIPLVWVEQASNTLLSIMGLLFIPSGAGILLYFNDAHLLLLLLLGLTLVLLGVSPVVGHLVQHLASRAGPDA